MNGSFLSRHYLENDISVPDFFMTHTTGFIQFVTNFRNELWDYLKKLPSHINNKLLD